jgi:hypothetical protein
LDAGTRHPSHLRHLWLVPQALASRATWQATQRNAPGPLVRFAAKPRNDGSRVSPQTGSVCCRVLGCGRSCLTMCANAGLLTAARGITRLEAAPKRPTLMVPTTARTDDGSSRLIAADSQGPYRMRRGGDS